jgi:uncharacterized protein
MLPEANLLREERSPYLLQHAENPVHWRSWGKAALAEAAELNRPILLSVGYAACHWCHVMAHESFEDDETAALMNRLFVNIKVDREERPDIDHIYMSALHAMGRQGGWPLTMFLAPDGTPFWGGTYFPKVSRYGQPSFKSVLNAVSEAWAGNHEAVAKNRVALAEAMARQSESNPGPLPGRERLRESAMAWLRVVDGEHGGLQGSPKFPNPPVFRFLWQEEMCGGARGGVAATHHLLRAMSLGGIYDHLGGGYARYSTDAEWLVPHFEKMLYDNGQLLELLALAQADAPEALYAARAAETVGWLQRDMVTGLPGDALVFAASEDADSEGEEGRFYVWHDEELDALLGADAAEFKAAYDVRPEGNWEGRTILQRVGPGDEAVLARGRSALFAARAERVRPGRDDKVLADWNALTISGLVRAAAVFGRADWLAAAERCFAQIDALLGAADGRLNHAWRDSHVTAAGLLDDQAAGARAALALYEATGNAAYLARAEALVAVAHHWFGDADGSFFASAADAPDVPAARPRIAADNATPSGNALMAEVLARLWHLTGETRFHEAAERVIAAFAGGEERMTHAPGLMAATRLLLDGACVMVAGPAEDATARALLAAALATPNPAVCVLRATPESDLREDHPAFGKAAFGVAAYVCRNQSCGLPLREPATLVAALREAAVKPA